MLSDLEKALAGAKRSMEIAAAGDAGHVYVLLNAVPTTRRPTQNRPQRPCRTQKLLADPSPISKSAFFPRELLRHEQRSPPTDCALSSVAAGRTLPGSDGQNPHRTDLISKRAAELGALKRWPEDRLLPMTKCSKDKDRSRQRFAPISIRGRGMALFELGRKTEAKDAYLEALKLVGNDPQAKKHETASSRAGIGGLEKRPPSVTRPSRCQRTSAAPDKSAPPKPWKPTTKVLAPLLEDLGCFRQPAAAAHRQFSQSSLVILMCKNVAKNKTNVQCRIGPQYLVACWIRLREFLPERRSACKEPAYYERPGPS